jgi:GT2 family glycosyltransferase
MTRISVLIGCYGAWPQYSIRAVESVLNHSHRREALDVYVGCNETSPEILAAFRKHLDEERIEALVESRRNINKDPMMRVLLEMCQTEYALWMDDDSHVLPGWDEKIIQYIDRNRPFDAAGDVHFIRKRSPDLAEFLRKRPWYKSREFEREPIFFPVGGMFLARVDWLRKHQFPDPAMLKKLDDVLLGELIAQQNGILHNFAFDRPLMERLRINDAPRRGTGEGADGWKSAPASNGQVDS